MNWLSVQESCTNIIDFCRGMIGWIIDFITDSSMYDTLCGQVLGGTLNIGDAVKATGLTLCVLFFLIDFFNKSLHLQWVTWENVMLFFMKLFVAKIILENAGSLLSMIQNGLSSIITTSDLYAGYAQDAIDAGAGWTIAFQIFPDDHAWGISYFLDPSTEEYSRALNAASDLWGDIDLNAGFYNITITITGLIMQLVFIITAIIVVARIFELLVYTAIAPIPLSTLSCDGLQDVGKGFLKSYAAVCLQAAVIVIMIIVYRTMMTNQSLLHLDQLDKRWVTLLVTFIFGAGIMQSGSWAKKFCGSM